MAALFVAGCSYVETDPVQDERDPSDREQLREVRFMVSTEAVVRGSVSPEDSRVSDINIIIYRDGMLVCGHYTDDPSDLRLKLAVGEDYNIYALANVGRIEAEASEDLFRKDCVYFMDSVSELGDTLPMCWSFYDLDIGSSDEQIDVCLRRLAGRVFLSVDKSALTTLRIVSARLCQSASVVRPFRHEGEGGSRAESPDEVMDGDYALEEDLLALNSGRQVEFYALENCQGILMPDNDDASAKVPDNLGERGQLCTYMEVECAFDDGGVLNGTVTYRFYLGLDAVTSFDLPGNASLYVQLTLTGDGLDEVSWRVDADVELLDGYAAGRIIQGLHPVSELYVGEVFLYEVTLSEPLIDYLEGELEGCFIALEGEQDEAIGFTRVGGSVNTMLMEARCLHPCSGTVSLYDSDGEKLASLSSAVNVTLPETVVCEFPYADEDGYIEPLTYMPECGINGDSERLYLYLTDRRRNALNHPDAYGFDFDIFDFSGSFSSDAADAVCALEAVVIPGNREPDGCAFEVSIKCTNDGSDGVLNRALADMTFGHGSTFLHLSDASYGFGTKATVCTAMLPVSMEIVDNGWAEYHSSRMSAIVDNPSNLPLEIDVWQVDRSVSDWNAVSGNQVIDYVESTLDITAYGYITGAFTVDDNPVFVSGCSFVCERNDDGDSCIEDGDLMIYPLTGIDTDDISKALLYDRHTQSALHHLVDVTVCGYPVPASALSVQDCLNDGSMKYELIYEGLNDQGIWVFSADQLLYSPGNLLDDFPNLSPGALARMQQRQKEEGPVKIYLEYDGDTLLIYTYRTPGGDSPLTLTCRFSGTVQGYVQTHPNGTMGKEQDNYCEVTFDRTVSGVLLDKPVTPVYPDGGVLKDAMDGIYAHTYTDSNNWIGLDSNRFQHHAHPIAMDCCFEAYVEGEDGKELYPVEVIWVYDVLEYHHEQDGVTYECPIRTENMSFRIGFVTKRN